MRVKRRSELPLIGTLFHLEQLVSEHEKRKMEEVRERTLQFLSDALKKKRSLLLEEQKTRSDDCPFITTNLLTDLIQELRKVTFAITREPEINVEVIAYPQHTSEDRTIYLSEQFWKENPVTLREIIIHAMFHLLGYGDTVQEDSDRAQRSPQSMLCPLTAHSAAIAIIKYMDHDGSYTPGSYSCCGETSRDTVCQESGMAKELSSTMTGEDNLQKPLFNGLTKTGRRQAGRAKERTLRLLSDALKKNQTLLVDDPEEFEGQKMMSHDFPLITTDLVKELIQELKKVTFAKVENPEEHHETVAYVYPGSEDRTIYLCELFWKEDSISQQDTMIHEVSHFLGYGHTLEENSDRVRESPQSMLCPLTAYSMASAITSDMNHGGSYRDGSYTCCGETSRGTVCEKSRMADRLWWSREKANMVTGSCLLLERYLHVTVFKTHFSLLNMSSPYQLFISDFTDNISLGTLDRARSMKPGPWAGWTSWTKRSGEDGALEVIDINDARIPFFSTKQQHQDAIKIKVLQCAAGEKGILASFIAMMLGVLCSVPKIRPAHSPGFTNRARSCGSQLNSRKLKLLNGCLHVLFV